MGAHGTGTAHRWRLRAGDVSRAVANVAGAAVGLLLAGVLVPDFDVGGWERALAAAVLLFAVGFALRPVLVRLAVPFGWLGSVLVGFFAQAVVLVLLLWDPGSVENGLLPSMVASWVVAACCTVAVWVLTAGTEDALTASLLRRARRSRVQVPDPDVTGVLFVQLDGVPYPVMDWAVRAGTLPTLSRWVRSGEYRLAEWRPMLPATTPASQMGILHGTIEGIPAFRWVDRSERKVYVANKPADAALLEARHSDGLGLLADDGVSVSNLFTGDAPTAYATMSAVHRTQETKETRLALAHFLASPNGLVRSVPRMAKEVVLERFQARRARLRDIRPRVARPWGFVGERAALAGILRDMNTALVADAMMKGRRSIYVDYVDYDAIAHHVGMMRPEALEALEALDTVLAQLERIAAAAPRRYHVVVLSDHGQSQGAVFRDRYGEDLAALVGRLARADVLVTERSNAEGAGALNSVLASSAGADSVVGRSAGRLSQRYEDAALGAGESAAPSTGDERKEPFLVFGSGNLGLVYVADQDHRLTRQELDRRFPGLVAGVAAHPGVGFVVVDTEEHGPVAIGARGEHRLRDGVVAGGDPLEAFGPSARSFVLRAATMAETPDLLVNSLVDDLDEVAAFEDLVGCHGGLGGWQDRATLLWPTSLAGPERMVVGADALHRLFVGWLEGLGHRTGLHPSPGGTRRGADRPRQSPQPSG